MFSIVVPFFNAGSTVRRTVDSILAQSFGAFELVLVDDGSSDDGADRLSDLADPRIRIVRQSNGGVAAARNRGIAEAAHDWIAFLDADDLWLPDHLAELDRVRCRFPEAGLIGCAYLDTDDHGRFEPPSDEEGRIEDIDFFDRIGRGERALWIGSVAIPRRIFDAVGGFRHFAHGDDSDMLARIALDHQVAASSRATAVYVHGHGGMTQGAKTRWQGADLRRADDIAPAVAVVAERCRRADPAGRPAGADRFVDHYIGWVLKVSVGIGDVATIRKLRRLYRGRPSLEERLLLRLGGLPAPAARLAYRLGLAAKARLRSLRTGKARPSGTSAQSFRNEHAASAKVI